MVKALTGGRVELADIPGARKLLFMAFGFLVMLSAAALVTPAHGPASVLLHKPGALGMRKPTAILAFANPHKLQEHFNSIGYDIDAVRLGESDVPRVLLARVPDGLATMKRIERRKRVFISLMLPLVLEANDRVLRVRARVLLYRAKAVAGKPLTKEQADDLARIAATYGVAPDGFGALLSRIDAVPPSLALAQAAIESGWGTSRFVLEGNAPFGQWTTEDQEGIVPAGREAGKTHKIRSFDRLIDSVHSYLHNLNTHRAYDDFRSLRAAMRGRAQPLDGYRLVPGMTAYSERKEEYLGLLRQVIEANNLRPLDDAQLSDRPQRQGAGA